MPVIWKEQSWAVVYAVETLYLSSYPGHFHFSGTPGNIQSNLDKPETPALQTEMV